MELRAVNIPGLANEKLKSSALRYFPTRLRGRAIGSICPREATMSGQTRTEEGRMETSMTFGILGARASIRCRCLRGRGGRR